MSDDNLILFPNVTQLYIKKAIQAIEEEQYSEAEQFLEEVLKLDPEHDEALQILQALQDLHESLMDQTNARVVEPSLIKQWREDLLQTEFKTQWETFDQMFGFMQEEVQDLIEDFLVYESGDALLKTKLLQECKQVCPGSWSFSVKKGSEAGEVKLENVPLMKEEWPEEALRPLQILQDRAHDNPTVIQMGTEVWFYFLEKCYPFLPENVEALSWTAGLHLYTLKMITPDMKDLLLHNKLVQRYELSREELLFAEQRFEQLLFRL